MRIFFILIVLWLFGLFWFGLYKHQRNINNYMNYRNTQTLDTLAEKVDLKKPISIITLFYDSSLIDGTSGAVAVSTGSSILESNELTGSTSTSGSMVSEDNELTGTELSTSTSNLTGTP